MGKRFHSKPIHLFQHSFSQYQTKEKVDGYFSLDYFVKSEPKYIFKMRFDNDSDHSLHEFEFCQTPNCK